MDVICSARIKSRYWNEPCVHDTDVERTRGDFLRLTNPEAWTCIRGQDRRRLAEISTCCLRFVPDWQVLIAQALDACFLFPDSTVRGLLWRCVCFAVKMNTRLPYSVMLSIKNDIARRMNVEGDLQAVLVDGFLDALDSHRLAADTRQS